MTTYERITWRDADRSRSAILRDPRETTLGRILGRGIGASTTVVTGIEVNSEGDEVKPANADERKRFIALELITKRTPLYMSRKYAQLLAAPTPLPASSPQIRTRRYQAWVGGDRNERGGSPGIAEGRFATYDNAKAWADLVHPDAPIVNITLLTASSGWISRLVSQRRAGDWTVPARIT